MKKLLYAVDNNVNTLGGEQECVKILLHTFHNDYNVTLFQPGCINVGIDRVEFKSYTKKNRLKEVFKNPFEVLNFFVNLYKVIKKQKPDILHTQSQVVLFAVSFLLSVRLLKKSFVFIHTDHGIYSKYPVFFQTLFVWSFKNVDTLVVTTNLNKRMWAFAAKRNAIKLRIETIENAAGEIFEAARLEKLPTMDNISIGFAGRFCDWKNWELAEDIVCTLNTRFTSFTVNMAIACSNDTELKSANLMINRLLDLLGERFHAEINLDISSMPDFFNKIDLFIVTSNKGSESFGRTVIEAMTYGCVVLTTDCGGPVEIISNPSLVLDSASAFANIIIHLHTDIESFSIISKTNLNIVRDKYSLSNNINKHDLLYRNSDLHK